MFHPGQETNSEESRQALLEMTRLLDGCRHADGVFIGDGCVLSFAQTAFNSEVAVISPAFATEPTLSRRLLVALGGHPRALN